MAEPRRVDLLLEAERRGLSLPDEDRALLNEARTRGFITSTGTVEESPAPSKVPAGELTTAQRLIRSATPSVIGGAIGGAAGTLVAPGVGTGFGIAIGSAAGEAVTQFLDPLKAGIKEPSLVQIGAAGALPVVPAIARRFFVSLPGAAAGLQDFLFKKLGQKGEALVSKFAPPPGTAADLFREAKRSGASVRIPLNETTGAATTISEEVAKSQFATGGAKALAKRAQEFTASGAAAFDDFRLNQSDLGAVIRSLEQKGGAALGRAKLLYKAMVQDLDSALASAQGQTAEKLAKAIDAFKREEAAQFFKDALVKSTARRVGRQNLDVDALMTRVDRNRDVLERLLPKAEVDDALEALRGFSKIPMTAKTPRLGFEQMPFAERAIVGGAIGFAAGGSVGAAGGVLAVEALSTALTSPPGRKLVQLMAEHGATLDQIGNALLQTGRGTLTME